VENDSSRYGVYKDETKPLRIGTPGIGRIVPKSKGGAGRFILKKRFKREQGRKQEGRRAVLPSGERQKPELKSTAFDELDVRRQS